MAIKIETHKDWTNGEALKYRAIHPATTPINTQAIANIVLLTLTPYGLYGKNKIHNHRVMLISKKILSNYILNWNDSADIARARTSSNVVVLIK